jgi:hypothetical protein
VLAGSLEAGLVPRGSTLDYEVVLKKMADRESAHRTEVEALKAEIVTLKSVNDTLGKAIGLLHKWNEQEPEGSSMNGQDDSSNQRTS